MAGPYPYLWITIVGGFVSFLTGSGVGMNDLSNAFGTTYGAKVLTLTQICILASICEFTGAVSLGGAVTSTISGGIASPENFRNEPYLFMYGMLCASGAAFCWLALATWFTLPVSSTHSICGGVIGFALVYGGVNAVQWAVPQEEFPFVGGVVPIIASWFISPLLTGGVAALLYGIIRYFVLRPANSVMRAIYTLPIIVSVTFFLESFFVLYKGAKNRLHWSVSRAAWVGAIVGVAAGAISCVCIPLLKRRIAKLKAKEQALAEERGVPVSVVEMELLQPGGEAEDYNNLNLNVQRAAGRNAPVDDVDDDQEGYPKKEGKPRTFTGAVVSDDDDAPMTPEVTDVGIPVEGQTASGLNVQIYDPHTEYVYRYLQIFTAICASFAHGASDVSNAVGPFAAIYGIYTSGTVDFGSETPIWILCLGGCGLILGLSTFGVRLMRLLGEKITVITPSRGFSAELSAALVVSFASGYGIPVSSTHCITGAVIAISIMDVGFKKVKWTMVLKMYAGWVGTLAVTAIMSGTFYAQGINSPSRP